MANEIVLDVERVVATDATRTTCIVRCLQGDLVEGTRLRAVDHRGAAIPAGPVLVVVEMRRYERRVDLVDPPHTTLVVLDGTLGPGIAPVQLVGEP